MRHQIARKLRPQVHTVGVATRPYAFTEHGAVMAANVLNSKRAVAMSVYVVRAFVKLREVLAGSSELAKKLERPRKETDRETRHARGSDHRTVRANQTTAQTTTAATREDAAANRVLKTSTSKIVSLNLVAIRARFKLKPGKLRYQTGHEL